MILVAAIILVSLAGQAQNTSAEQRANAVPTPVVYVRCGKLITMPRSRR